MSPAAIEPETSRRRADTVLALLIWGTGLTVIATLDPALGHFGQSIYGVALSAVMVSWLFREEVGVRAQTLAALLSACVLEILGTSLEWWTYRLGNFPGWVPAGHACLFLTCLVITRSLPPTLRGPGAVSATTIVCGLWTAWGVLISDRPDLCSLFLFCLLLLFLRHPVIAPRIPTVFVICSITEFAGVLSGAWAYRAPDEGGLVTIGNPPAAIAGGYCLIDYCALRLAGGLEGIRWCRRMSG